MNTQTPTTHHHTCEDERTCRECASGARNRFFKGKRMRAEEFRLEQTYGLARRRLINRAVLGWGVVRGLKLYKPATPPVPFRVGSGFALDRRGRELLLVEPVELTEKNTFLAAAGQTGCEVQPIDSIKQTTSDDAGAYMLMAHYAERRFGDVPQLDDCGCDPPEKNFTCETIVFSLTPLANGKCPCEEADCDRVCECRQAPKADVAQQTSSVQQAPAQPAPDLPTEKTCGEKGRGPHECLCQWVTNAGEPKTPSTLCSWNGYCVAIPDGVPLACVKAWKKPKDDAKGCDVIVIELTDGCSPRRLVKNNDLLYDLVRGCDLTRIKSISWEGWHRRLATNNLVPWSDFFKKFFRGEPLAGEDLPLEVDTDFFVTFSGPVQVGTLRPDVVAMTIVTLDKADYWGIARRVPILSLDPTPSAPRSDGLTDQLRLRVSGTWIYEVMAKRAATELSNNEFFTVEIEVRGDLILDCHNQSVDGNSLGATASPSGNGTPGGSFLSSFRVQPKIPVGQRP